MIVGVGAAGGVLLQRLARAGFSVVGFEAGPFWDTERDWVTDEAGSHKLYWNDLRITGGEHPLALGANNSGEASAAARCTGPRLRRAFILPTLRSTRVTASAPTGRSRYADLEPYYELLEQEMPVAGPAWFPWGNPHGYPYGPHPMGGVGDALIRGCTALGIPCRSGRPRGDPFRFARRPSALHLSRLLHPGLQSGRESKHADHPCARCAARTARRSATTAWSSRISLGKDGRDRRSHLL